MAKIEASGTADASFSRAIRSRQIKTLQRMFDLLTHLAVGLRWTRWRTCFLQELLELGVFGLLSLFVDLIVPVDGGSEPIGHTITQQVHAADVNRGTADNDVLESPGKQHLLRVLRSDAAQEVPDLLRAFFPTNDPSCLGNVFDMKKRLRLAAEQLASH